MKRRCLASVCRTIVWGLSLVAGCNSAPSGPKLVPVQGVVTLDGKPLGSADIMFVPQGDTKGQGGVGRTDSAGKFELQSHDRKHKGAPVGTYRVIMSKLVKPDGTDYIPDPNAGPIDTGGFKELLPTAYSDMGQTKLESTIPDGGAKTLEFKLNSKAR
jgi:hypothetical protein